MEKHLSEDSELIRQAHEGDEMACQVLVERYMRMVYALALDMTGDHHDAEDLSQETFMKAFRSLDSFKSQAKFSSWLCRITINLCIDRRRRRRINTVSIAADVDDSSNGPVSRSGSPQATRPEVEIERALLQERVADAIAGLPDRERAVFVLRHYHRSPIKEIAKVLQVKEGTVKSTLFKALKRLQERLGSP